MMMMLELVVSYLLYEIFLRQVIKFTSFNVIMFGMMGVVLGPLSRVALLTPAIPGTNGF